MSTDDTQDSDEPKHPYETEDSFHPLGEEWEQQMREELEDTEYDADLGMEMARDAQRLVAGEISEEEFYSEYHDDVQEEFETDARPLFEGVSAAEHDEIEEESVFESLSDIDLEADDTSRREMMKKMGAGAAFLGYGAVAGYDFQPDEGAPANVSGIRPKPKGERDNRWGMVIDLERCDGCLACVAGCINENGTSTGANWMYVFNYEDKNTDQDNFLVRPCQHCSNAPCAKVCPVRARHVRGNDGLVLTDYEVCIGCRYCQVACPYGVNYFQWGEPDVPMEEYPHLQAEPEEVRNMTGDALEQYKKQVTQEDLKEIFPEKVENGRVDESKLTTEEKRRAILTVEKDHVYDQRGRWVDGRPPQGVMGKCTFCPTRQDGHSERPKGTTACQDACDQQGMSAIHFGDFDRTGEKDGEEPSRPVKYLNKRVELSESEQNYVTKLWGDQKPVDWDDGDQNDELGIRTTASPEAEVSSFRLLEELGTEPNVVYLGNEPGPEAEQKEPPTPYEAYSGSGNEWGIKVKDKRLEHLKYGASGPPKNAKKKSKESGGGSGGH